MIALDLSLENLYWAYYRYLNSQFFANVYLDRLDQFVKHELRCRHYLRYCDERCRLGRWLGALIAY